MRHIHTSIVSMHLAARDNNKILSTPPPHIISSEEIHHHLTRRTLCPTMISPFPNDITLPQSILTQSRRQSTYIATMPPL